MLPEDLKVQFWLDVLTALVQRHRLTADAATAAIQSYRAWLAEKEIGDLIYHRDAESVAETAAAAWWAKLPGALA